MKILVLVNWKIIHTQIDPKNIQPPDFQISGQSYWFFENFPNNLKIKVLGIGNSWFTNRIEKYYLKFYILQTLIALLQLKKYDVILSHGAQSGIFLALLRKLFRISKPKHILFDIGGFNSASEKGFKNTLIRYASRSLDGVIIHTSKQRDYYEKHFPWLVSKTQFINFGTNPDYFNLVENLDVQNTILSVGYSKRDWKTLIRAFDDVKDKSVVLKIIGRSDLILNNQNIILEKYIPINQLIEEIRKCKFVVVPLEYFNYSFGQMTVLQAMSLGKAVIASKVPSLEDYIIDGETGLFYESGNADDLSNKISFLLNNNDLIVKLGVNSRKAIEQKFNEKEMAKEIHNFLNLILNQNFK